MAKIRPNQIVGYENAAPGKNLAINSSFEVWQRGTSFTSLTGTGKYGPDEWFVNGGNATSIVCSRSASAKVGNYSAQCAITAAAGNYAYITQGIEQFKQLEGQYVTLSAWVNTSTPNVVQLVLADWVSSPDQQNSRFHQATGWERLSVTKLVRTGLSTVVGTSHSFGLYFSIIGYGTVTYAVDGVSLVVGNYQDGVPYVPENPAVEFARCQRFYEVHGGQFATHPFINTYAAASTYVGCSPQFTVQKYATPTLTRSGNWTFNGTTLNADYPSLTGYRFYSTAGAGAGQYNAYPTDATGIITAEVPF